MITPVLTSPNTIPTNKPVTIGLESNEVPKAYSDCAIKAMQPKKNRLSYHLYFSFLQDI